MRTLRMAFVGGFAGASMAGNVATLQEVRRHGALTNISSRSEGFRYLLRTGYLPGKPLDG